MPPLISLLSCSDEETASNAAGALFNCASDGMHINLFMLVITLIVITVEAAIAIRLCNGISNLIKACRTAGAADLLLANAAGALMNCAAYGMISFITNNHV